MTGFPQWAAILLAGSICTVYTSFVSQKYMLCKYFSVFSHQFISIFINLSLSFSLSRLNSMYIWLILNCCVFFSISSCLILFLFTNDILYNIDANRVGWEAWYWLTFSKAPLSSGPCWLSSFMDPQKRVVWTKFSKRAQRSTGPTFLSETCFQTISILI